MGSGFSACSGPNSVGISADPSRDATKVKATQAQVHSDSCDSGISVCEGAKQLKKGRQHVRANPGIHDVESEEEMVAGSDVGCGTDFLMTSTPRQDVKKAESDSDGSVQLIDTRKGRPQSRTSSKTSLRNNPHSAPNLLDHAIHEEDEEEYDGEPEDKRLRAQRPPRPKSAHFRKSRAQARARSAKSRSSHARNGSVSGGESSADLSSEEDGFDSDVLSIPDETTSHSARPNTLTTIRLGPQFQAPTSPPINTPTHNDNHHLNHHHDHDDDMDWWNDDVDSARQTGGHVSRTYSDYSASGSFTWRGGVLVREGRVAKKASERSISSILLTTAVELDSSGSALNTTNPACFAVTNPEITQHILKF
nr:hypothetical protein BaRGS_034766 [Batillaria attramentaria]